MLVPRKAGELEGKAAGREGHASALAMGVLTAVLATPCSFAILTAGVRLGAAADAAGSARSAC